MSGWISVNDRLPPNGRVYVYLAKTGEYLWADFWQSPQGVCWADCEGELHNVTHWQPLPDPPKGDA